MACVKRSPRGENKSPRPRDVGARADRWRRPRHRRAGPCRPRHRSEHHRRFDAGPTRRDAGRRSPSASVPSATLPRTARRLSGPGNSSGKRVSTVALPGRGRRRLGLGSTRRWGSLSSRWFHFLPTASSHGGPNDGKPGPPLASPHPQANGAGLSWEGPMRAERARPRCRARSARRPPRVGRPVIGRPTTR